MEERSEGKPEDAEWAAIYGAIIWNRGISKEKIEILYDLLH